MNRIPYGMNLFIRMAYVWGIRFRCATVHIHAISKTMWHAATPRLSLGLTLLLAGVRAADECPPHRKADVARVVRAAWRCDMLPLGGRPGSFKGVNAEIGALAPKRAWQNGSVSNSLARQTQHEFMWSFVAKYRSQLSHHTRCLDWDGWYGGSVFAQVCSELDVIEYGKPFGRTTPKRLRWRADAKRRATRWYLADAHSMASHLDHDSYDLIIANSVFEHLHQPFVAMGEVVKLLKPGGFLFWHTPFEFEQHGVPADYFRYTVAGARALAESAGLVVDTAEPDGGYLAVLSNVLGVGSSFWRPGDLQRQPFPGAEIMHYLSTRMVARKPRQGGAPTTGLG